MFFVYNIIKIPKTIILLCLNNILLTIKNEIFLFYFFVLFVLLDFEVIAIRLSFRALFFFGHY